MIIFNIFIMSKLRNFSLNQVMARGDVMYTGVKQVKFEEVDNIDLIDSLGEDLLNKRGESEPEEVESDQKVFYIGDVELEIDIAPEFSPKISLLAYYVRNDREVVTASLEIPVENCFPNPVL